ncbi:outer membrane beta-barrel protein [Segetibacter koreensis]|uniref:outer membrane beta-barrel protein n=1 Tax=Segetibacter koreensis TaxID=398037 RepID=UPI000362427F|nr:outer membrane beta-barrel protein [Segetibacter koreensis]
MEDNFNQNNFEEFLKEEVRNHRMYPTDTVWRDINKKLHGDKKWPGLTVAAFTLLSVTIAICVYFTPQPDIFTVPPLNNEIKSAAHPNSQHNIIVLDNLTSSPSLYKEKTSFDSVVENQLIDKPVASVTSTSTFKQRVEKEVNKAVVLNVSSKNNIATELLGEHEVAANPSSAGTLEATKEGRPALPTIQRNEIIIAPGKIKPLAENERLAKEDNDKNMVDQFLKDHKDDIALYTTKKPKSLKNKFGFQIYIAPSISYRKLLEDRSVLKDGAGAGPVGLNYVADVNNVVRHKPGNGLEAGISILYNLSNNVRIKSGLQFNVRQYSIEAYRSSTELASIALVGNHGIDTVNTLAIYRNSNGFYSAELVNRYYQIAIPVGIEWEIIGNKTIQLNVAGSIQPTYLINRNAYLISTNFKNYSENPEMVRSFNINSNIETFVSFKAGYFKWQIGPQLRYQPYSTFIPQYPIKEHLMDYGIKIGLSKTF